MEGLLLTPRKSVLLQASCCLFKTRTLTVCQAVSWLTTYHPIISSSSTLKLSSYYSHCIDEETEAQ